jgi:acylphosphatase
VVVTGRVQMVGFRYTAQREANRLGIHGWIRNLSCGRRVELVASGEADAMATFLAWCQHGPSHAHVERVETTDADDSQALTGFQIKLTH